MDLLGPADQDRPKESCAVLGIYAPGERVAAVAYFALFALQHRGQESSGIAVADGKGLECYKEMGLVSQIFSPEILERLEGHIAVGHNRYSTTGSSRIDNAQPILAKSHLGPLALAHNGNLTNHDGVRRQLEQRGIGFSSTSDSEVIAKLFALAPGNTLDDKIKNTMNQLAGAYSVVLSTRDTLIAFRDPFGVRPLCIGELSDNGTRGWVIASESCALGTIGARYVREVKPGEAIIINEDGFRAFQAREAFGRHALCIFEYIYFARPDSVINGKSIYWARYNMGRQLAREHPVAADGVMAIPDSSVPAAIGFAAASGLPFCEGLIKNRYIARTFIQPAQRIRKLGIKLKFNPLKENIEGHKLIVVDDSIVRGNTTKSIVALLREVGAKEVHVRITSPPMIKPCYLGVDTARENELIASHNTVEQIRQHIQADSLGYLSLEGLLSAIDFPREDFCTGCFNGNYPGSGISDRHEACPIYV